MTTYKSIRGLTVQSVTTDPEVYANSWSSGGALNTARNRAASVGSVPASLAFGGTPPVTDAVEL